MGQIAVLCAAIWQRLCEGEQRMNCNSSCLLTVCSVLQNVHSSKVMLAAEQKVTCTVHWQLWARLWHRGDQVHWTCL
jgi:hypothetical protein